MAIGDILNRLMEEAGENPHSLSIKAKVPQPTIFRICHGTSRDPRRQTMEKLAKALGKPVEIFYGSSRPALSLAVNEIHGNYTVARQNEDERLLRALRLASNEQRGMLIALADKILEDFSSFDERAGAH